MKTALFDKTDMARALNFGKYTVLSINLDNQPYKKEMGEVGRKSTFTIGCKCRVAWDHKDPRFAGMTSKCELVIEDGRYMLTSGGSCLKADFTLDDFLEDVENANTPLVHKGETVAVAHYSKEMGIKFVMLMMVSERIDVHCMTVATLEKIAE